MKGLTFFFVQDDCVEKRCDCRKPAVEGKTEFRSVQTCDEFFKMVSRRVFEPGIIVACGFSQFRVSECRRLVDGKGDCSSFVICLVIWLSCDTKSVDFVFSRLISPECPHGCGINVCESSLDTIVVAVELTVFFGDLLQCA